jgi:putative ABC transport system ATP-binding protein
MAMMESPLTIEARDVRKAFVSGGQRAEVLRGVSLEVRHGEALFLVGPSGSGKTTLLSILGCILTPESGNVRVLGREVSRMGSQELTRFRGEHLGFIFQTFNLFPNLSATDNIRLVLRMRGVPLGQASARANELLGRLGLEARAHLFPGQLSSGECQRVAVARALAAEPAILFADEPTASLDARNGQAVMETLTQLTAERGVTLVVVSHDNRIYRFADRVLKLEDGTLRREWTQHDLGADWELLAASGMDSTVYQKMTASR